MESTDATSSTDNNSEEPARADSPDVTIVEEESSPSTSKKSENVAACKSPTEEAAAANTSVDSPASPQFECPICLQTFIHPARLPCGHIFCFLCIKGVAYKNQRCAMCRREIPAEFLDHPELVNGLNDLSITKVKEDGYKWFYEGRNGGWWAYDMRSSEEIETAYTKHSNSEVVDLEEGAKMDILICGMMYRIDFAEMVQFSHDMPIRRRKICRAKSMPTKGVAGISNLHKQ